MGRVFCFLDGVPERRREPLGSTPPYPAALPLASPALALALLCSIQFMQMLELLGTELFLLVRNLRGLGAVAVIALVTLFAISL